MSYWAARIASALGRMVQRPIGNPATPILRALSLIGCWFIVRLSPSCTSLSIGAGASTEPSWEAAEATRCPSCCLQRTCAQPSHEAHEDYRFLLRFGRLLSPYRSVPGVAVTHEAEGADYRWRPARRDCRGAGRPGASYLEVVSIKATDQHADD